MGHGPTRTVSADFERCSVKVRTEYEVPSTKVYTLRLGMVASAILQYGRTTRHLRMLTALAITSTTVISDTADWRSIAILAHRLRGSVSVGENAVAFVNDK